MTNDLLKRYPAGNGDLQELARVETNTPAVLPAILCWVSDLNAALASSGGIETLSQDTRIHVTPRDFDALVVALDNPNVELIYKASCIHCCLKVGHVTVSTVLLLNAQ